MNDDTEVPKVHEALQKANGNINKLGRLFQKEIQ